MGINQSAHKKQFFSSVNTDVLRDLLSWWMCYDHPDEPFQQPTEAGKKWLHDRCLEAGFSGIVDAYHTIKPKAITKDGAA